MTASFTQIATGLLLLSVLFLFIERMLGNRRGKPWFRKEWLTDVG
ncbi:MAG TPA: hypothetical protein PLA50_04900 [Bacteroidia bacterium]|nr:hypothetical protein [Bacteroidia bacterium]